MKKIYFTSDFHLGKPDNYNSLQREKFIVDWLESIKNEAEEINLIGDIFDFWHEWNYVVPRGYTRFFGKIAQLTDAGITINFITGNHDLWTYGYLKKELGMKVYYKPIEKTYNNKKFYLAHGDGLGPSDKFYKLLKSIFKNNFLQWCFANLLHPNFAMKIAINFALAKKSSNNNSIFKGEKEWLVIHSKKLLEQKYFDFFVYGHRHIQILRQLTNNSLYVGLGDCLKSFSYAVFDGNYIKIKKINF